MGVGKQSWVCLQPEELATLDLVSLGSAQGLVSGL